MRIEVVQADRPDKQLCRITRHGRRVLSDWLDRGPVEPSRKKTRTPQAARRGVDMKLLVVIAATLLLGTPVGGRAAAPTPPRLVDWCATKADRKAAIRFRAADGARLIGVLLGPARARSGVVLSHEGSGGLCNWLFYGRRLARQGHRVLAYDAAGFASSPGSRDRRWRYDHDVAGAARELRRRGVQRIVLVGGSLGAMSSIVAGADITPPVNGVVAVSPGAVFSGLDARAGASRLRVPVLYLAAEDDPGFPEIARSLYASTPSVEKQLVVRPTGGHGYQMLRNAAGAPNRELVDAFVRAHTAG
jgi:pimeloyl-ACP methyl ester carboxylesterase